MEAKPVMTVEDVHERLGTIFARYRTTIMGRKKMHHLVVRFLTFPLLARRFDRMLNELEDLYDATDLEVQAAYRRARQALRDLDAARARGDLVSREQIEAELVNDEDNVKHGSPVRDHL